MCTHLVVHEGVEAFHAVVERGEVVLPLVDGDATRGQNGRVYEVKLGLEQFRRVQDAVVRELPAVLVSVTAKRHRVESRRRDVLDEPRVGFWAVPVGDRDRVPGVGEKKRQE